MDWFAIIKSPYVVLVVNALFAIAFSGMLVNIYRRGYIRGGLTGKVYRNDPDFRWRIGVGWILEVFVVAIFVRSLVGLLDRT